MTERQASLANFFLGNIAWFTCLIMVKVVFL